MNKVRPWLLFVFPLMLLLVATIANSNNPPPISDPLLAYLQAAGFPAWAGVLAWAASKFSNDMKSIADRLERHELRTERRLTSLEILIKANNKEAGVMPDVIL